MKIFLNKYTCDEKTYLSIFRCKLPIYIIDTLNYDAVITPSAVYIKTYLIDINKNKSSKQFSILTNNILMGENFNKVHESTLHLNIKIPNKNKIRPVPEWGTTCFNNTIICQGNIQFATLYNAKCIDVVSYFDFNEKFMTSTAAITIQDIEEIAQNIYDNGYTVPYVVQLDAIPKILKWNCICFIYHEIFQKDYIPIRLIMFNDIKYIKLHYSKEIFHDICQMLRRCHVHYKKRLDYYHLFELDIDKKNILYETATNNTILSLPFVLKYKSYDKPKLIPICWANTLHANIDLIKECKYIKLQWLFEFLCSFKYQLLDTQTAKQIMAHNCMDHNAINIYHNNKGYIIINAFNLHNLLKQRIKIHVYREK